MKADVVMCLPGWLATMVANEAAAQAKSCGKVVAIATAVSQTCAGAKVSAMQEWGKSGVICGQVIFLAVIQKYHKSMTV